MSDMPELPEVETVRRGLAPSLEGARIDHVHLGRADLRFPFPENFAKRLTGARVTALGRRSKYLVADLDSAECLIMHLGMSGSFRVEEEVAAGAAFHHERSTIAAHDHVILTLEHGARGSPIGDARRFGFMDLIARSGLDSHPMIARLGIEPTGNRLDGAYLKAAFEGKRTSLKAVLLDQSIIAGLGNIYVAEALWRSGLSPLRAAGEVDPAALERLATVIRAVIAEAIEAGGSSLRDHRLTDGSLGYFQHRFAVYDREGDPCPTPACAGTIQRIQQSGRSTFHCPACQR